MQTAQKFLQNEQKLLTNSNFWEQFHHDFQTHSSHVDELNVWAQSAMFTLHLQLLSDSNYVNSLARAENEIIENNNLVIPIAEKNILKANLIAIKAGRNLPLHDHPGSSGSMLVISGDVRATVCELEKSIANQEQQTGLLTVTKKKILRSGESCCFTQKQHNIHSFEALTDRVVILVIHTPPFPLDQQSYFFTASPLLKIGSQALAQRVRVQALQKSRKNKIHNISGVVK